ncbi:MAG TPA: SUMF1/EgtB/PvdO family nonheme iron enzyme [Clostridia bacterium]|nr:SUMF1/EgtB/PvdO family nonheme iron enzyme [Clostridia bacterium]
MKTLMKCTAAAMVLLVGGQLARAAAPVVTNVVAAQRAGTKLVDIRYDVFDADGDPLKVRIEISHNGGTNYLVPANSLTGEFGNNIAPGTNKLVVWNAGVDWDGEYSPKMRVKVIASDNRGFPGMEWGQEVPPGGFLMGQDGGPEGIGPARHVNIPYSYWLSKYEVTVQQYLVFLNTALVAGDVTRNGSAIMANGTVFAGVGNGEQIYVLGNDIKWNLNKVEVVGERGPLPVEVNWAGAIAFAQYYGYDLPTDAEWEKAARGPDHDGLGEHLIYPWGNSISGGNANYQGSGDPYNYRTPVGYYNGNQIPFGPDMVSAYGLYDMLGNVREWTRTTSIPVDTYPATESITNSINSLTQPGKVMRGGSYNDSPWAVFQKSDFSYGWVGIRLVRRAQ